MGQIFQKPEYELAGNFKCDFVGDSAGDSPIESAGTNNYVKVNESNPYNRIVSDPIDIPEPPIKRKIQTLRSNPQIRTI